MLAPMKPRGGLSSVWVLVLAFAVAGCDCGSSDDPMPVDAGGGDAGTDARTPDLDGGDEMDAGPEDAGGGDAGGVDAGRDAGGVDAGEPDAGPPDAGPPDSGPPDGGPPPLPACVVDPEGAVVVTPGFQVETIAIGAPLFDPVGLTVGLDGNIYVANSHSWLMGVSDPGEIMRVDADGTLTTFLSEMRLRGPAWVAFGPGGAAGGPGIAYLGTEDADEAGIHTSDWLLIYDGTTTTVGPSTYENGKVAFAPGGAFGSDLWFPTRESATGGPPNPYRMHRWDPAAGGAPVLVPITDGATATLIGAVSSFTCGNGGGFGTDLYVVTYVDAPGFTPGSEAAVWRVNDAFEATRLTTGNSAADLAVSPDPAGPWGDFLYGTFDIGSVGHVRRVSPTGEETDLVTDLGYTGALLFAPDGSLWVTDPGADRIARITPCTPAPSP